LWHWDLGIWRSSWKRGTIFQGVGFGLIHFPFSSHAPTPITGCRCPINSKLVQAAIAARTEAPVGKKEILLDFYPM
jgi:hypothetical protein